MARTSTSEKVPRGTESGQPRLGVVGYFRDVLRVGDQDDRGGAVELGDVGQEDDGCQLDADAIGTWHDERVVTEVAVVCRGIGEVVTGRGNSSYRHACAAPSSSSARNLGTSV